jgi:hypothetical protein
MRLNIDTGDNYKRRSPPHIVQLIEGLDEDLTREPGGETTLVSNFRSDVDSSSLATNQSGMVYRCLTAVMNPYPTSSTNLGYVPE